MDFMQNNQFSYSFIVLGQCNWFQRDIREQNRTKFYRKSRPSSDLLQYQTKSIFDGFRKMNNTMKILKEISRTFI